MKQKYIKILLAVFLALVILIVVTQVILHFSGAEIDIQIPTPLLVFLCVMLIICGVLGVVYLVRYNIKLKQLFSAYQQRDYSEVIVYKKYASLYLPSYSKDKALLYVAVSYLELGDENSFLDVADKIANKKIQNDKFMWLAINALLKNNLQQFLDWQQKLHSSSCKVDKELNIRILEVLYSNIREQVALSETDIDLIHNLNSNLIEQQLNLYFE